MRTVKLLYTNGFARFCSEFYVHVDDGPEPARPMNSSCYMRWDLDGIECRAISGDAEMLDASLDVLAFALSLPRVACQESALHGLGHLAFKFRARTTPIIEHYLRQAKLPEPLRTYARAALAGCVQ